MPETNATTAQAAPPSGAPTLDARDLARLAEWADGLRDQELILVMKDGKLQLKVPAGGDDPILKLRTTNIINARQRPRVTFESPGHGRLQIEETADSVFWTESAVEKFVFPYYSAQRLLTEDEMKEFRRRFLDDPNAVAVLHTPPTRSFVATAGIDSIKVVQSEVREDGTRELKVVTLAQYLL